MGEYFEGVFYEERALPYMGLAILGVIAICLIVLFIHLARKWKVTDDTAIAVCILCSAYLVLMCVGFYNGYLEPNHGSQRKEDISTYVEAVEWNKEEQRCNNYFFRFTLRDEDLVDLSKFEVSESVQEMFD